MAYDEGLRSITLIADASVGIYTGPPGMPGSLSPNGGSQFKFVKVTTAPGNVGLCTALLNEIPVGILQNKPQSAGGAATVGVRGVSMVLVGAGQTFTGNEPVKIDALGCAAVGISGTDPIRGTALTAGGAGDLISVLLV